LGVFENRVLSKIFGPEREEVGGGRGKSHKEELKKLYASPNIIRVTKSRSVRLARHIARMEVNEKYVQHFGWEDSKEETS